jgi:hypothetical protein
VGTVPHANNFGISHTMDFTAPLCLMPRGNLFVSDILHHLRRMMAMTSDIKYGEKAYK